VNRRGELEKAIAAARIGPAAYALFTQLLRRSGNDTGEVDDPRFTPTLARLAEQAKMSRSTGFLALAELERHGWLKRYETADRSRVAGVLLAGHDCDCARDVTALCQGPGCCRPLTGMRRDARYHSDACRQRAHRAVRGAVTTLLAASPGSRDVSRIEPCRVTGRAVTASPESRDKPQVTTKAASCARKEITEERKGEGTPANDLWRHLDLGDVVQCPFCGAATVVGEGMIVHAAGCWRGAILEIYDRQA
jgi:hypothetical protein